MKVICWRNDQEFSSGEKKKTFKDKLLKILTILSVELCKNLFSLSIICFIMTTDGSKNLFTKFQFVWGFILFVLGLLVCLLCFVLFCFLYWSSFNHTYKVWQQLKWPRVSHSVYENRNVFQKITDHNISCYSQWELEIFSDSLQYSVPICRKVLGN